MNKVKLIAYTQPVMDMSSQDFIAYCARVSNPSNQNNTDTAGKLIKYLVKNSHWSPLQMVNIVMDVETTRDIGRQLLRHEFKIQEFSQRYANPTEMGFVYREARLQDNKNRQNSIDTNDEELISEWNQRQSQVIEDAKLNYQWAIDNGVAKEQARTILPEGLTMSRLFVSGTLRNWYHYTKLRMSNGTQKEHMELAEMCWNELIKVYPILKEI